MGNTPKQKAVIRIEARDFINARLQYIEPCVEFTPHEQCHWTDETRLATIQALCGRVMELGDVSKNKPETAPPLELCKPLDVNEETRWKSKAMKQENPSEAETETMEDIVNKARLILNKISWTTLDKLTNQFQDMVVDNDEVRKVCIQLLVNKAQTEHHFGPMYAQLCANIGKQHKVFKKELLTQCQQEFEVDTDHKIEAANKGVEDADLKDYNATLIRKAYIGHVKFLGELYLRDVVKLSIMMHCLDELLKDMEHEESLECFAHMMTTMGEKLDGHAKQNNKPFDWSRVQALRQSTTISNRIKFLLQDLLELKGRGWVKRREEETAKTIDQIHKEVAKEEQKAKMNRRPSSQSSLQSSLRRATSMSSAPTIDEDGFVEINRQSMRRVSSKSEMGSRQNSNNNIAGMNDAAKIPPLRRSQSQPTSMSQYTSPFLKKNLQKKSDVPTAPPMPVPMEDDAPMAPPTLSPEECGKKIKNVLKEYFVGGDTDDAVLTVHELVQVGTDGSVERGGKVIEGASLMVMEMKAEEVDKALKILLRCIVENKLQSESIVLGLNDPLEFLSDIEIDAPLAGNHLAKMISEYVKLNVLSLEMLKEAPEYFRTDGKPASFCVKILKQRGGEVLDSDLAVVEALMTEDDKNTFDSAKAMYEA